MTYAELGAARGISTASAERLAKRRRWARQMGNDGLARVMVPIGEDRITPRRHKGISPHDIENVIREAIREVVTPLSVQLEHERTRADRAEQRADEEHASRKQAMARVALEMDDLRRRLDQADTDRRQAQAQLAAAQERIAALLTDQHTAAPPARRSWWPWRRA